VCVRCILFLGNSGITHKLRGSSIASEFLVLKAKKQQATASDVHAGS
jgi:hypothetical protein